MDLPTFLRDALLVVAAYLVGSIPVGVLVARAAGGPDPRRGIYPTIVTVTSEGVTELDDDTIAPLVDSVMGRRP